jgi:hypothetical protein
VQLLATASQNPVQPLHTINGKVGAPVEQISREQYISYPQPVERVGVTSLCSFPFETLWLKLLCLLCD